MNRESATASIHPGAYPMLRVALLYASGIAFWRMAPVHVQEIWQELPALLYALVPANPYVNVVAAELVGIIATKAPLIPLLLLPLLFACMLGWVVWVHWRGGTTHRLYLLPALYLGLIFLFGWIRQPLLEPRHPPAEHMLQVFSEQELLFHITVLAQQQTRTGNHRITALVDSVHIAGLPVWKNPFKAMVHLPGEVRVDGAGALSLHASMRAPPGPRNPHQFNYRAFLSRQNIHMQLFANDVLHKHAGPPSRFWTRQQLRFSRSVDQLFSGENIPLARAVLMGDRSGLDADVRTAFSRAGLAHLMAVSGMHVGFLLMPLWFVLPWFRRSGLFITIGLLLTGVVLLTYAGITGFSVSVSRASVMSFGLAVARLFHKPGTSLNILGTAALILLLHDPLMLFDVGFQLSFLAVLVILTTLPQTRFLLPTKYRYGKIAGLFQFLMLSILVQGALYPILIHTFNEFSVAGPMANLLAVPMVQVLFLLALLSLLVSVAHLPSAALLNVPGDFLLFRLSELALAIGSHPAAWMQGVLPGWWVYGLWFFAFGLLASARLPRIRWKMAAGLMVFLVAMQGDRFIDSQRVPVLRVTFFDVGQGDALVLQTPAGRTFMYDTGAWTPTYDAAERVLLPELKAMGIKQLDGIVLSHPHADHIGGTTTLLQYIPVDTIYQPALSSETAVWNRYMAEASQRGIPVREVGTGDRIGYEPGFHMLVVSPDKDLPARDPNNQSVAIMALYGDTRMLLTGDAEKEAESRMHRRFGSFLASELLKAGHHGSRTSSHHDFLNVVRPKQIVISLGLRNRYNHPHPEATARLRATGASLYFTSLQGAIRFQNDGTSFRYIPWNGAPDCTLPGACP